MFCRTLILFFWTVKLNSPRGIRFSYLDFASYITLLSDNSRAIQHVLDRLMIGAFKMPGTASRLPETGAYTDS